MERTVRGQVPLQTLHGPDGRPLGRLVAPRAGPLVGRDSGTIYLVRGSGEAAGPPSSPPPRNCRRPAAGPGIQQNSLSPHSSAGPGVR